MSDAALVFRVGWEMMRGQLSWMPREGIRLAMRGSEETDGLMGSRLAGNFQAVQTQFNSHTEERKSWGK